MSLKKKIALSLFLSIFIISILVIFEYINFIKIKQEIRHLEVTDTIRSKAFEIRRHEKNFFLYPLKAKGESEAVHRYLHELNSILSGNVIMDKSNKLFHLKMCIKEYEQMFNKMESTAVNVSREFDRMKTSLTQYSKFFPLIQSSLVEYPLQSIEFLKDLYLLPSDNRLVIELKELDIQINALRKNGEDIILISEELDRIARDNVEKTIYISQVAIIIFFPLFIITGIGIIFFFNRDVVNRLKMLIDVVEKTGKGHFLRLSLKQSKDEVGTLIQKFNELEEKLAQRDAELERKNKELLQSQKLAAIGTLASGVAHELNNPLNNIYVSTQVLAKKMGDTSSSDLKEIVKDIRGQTLRVKRIVADLLDFARGKEPEFRKVELNQLITNAYNLLSKFVNMEKIEFVLNSESNGIVICADYEQIERVFINLFNNAVEAMSGEGKLIVEIITDKNFVKIKVTDTGKGMPPEDVEKVFEPFFSKKDKGTGLGLAIVFNIIKNHNGEITLESLEGKGTTFTVTLPKVRDCNGF
jgi:signal transduction histidine kinase